MANCKTVGAADLRVWPAGIKRRTLLASGLGVAGMLAVGRQADAAEPSAIEKANIQVVKDFCAAWPSHDLEKISPSSPTMARIG